MPLWMTAWWSRWWGCSPTTTRLWEDSCRRLSLLLRYEERNSSLKTIHFEVWNLQKTCNNDTVTPTYSLPGATVSICPHVHNSFSILKSILFHFKFWTTGEWVGDTMPSHPPKLEHLLRPRSSLPHYSADSWSIDVTQLSVRSPRLNFGHLPNNVLYSKPCPGPWSSLGLHTVCGHGVSSLSFCLHQLFNLLFLMALVFWKSLIQLLCRMPRVHRPVLVIRFRLRACLS